jgi:hypothetical protein
MDEVGNAHLRDVYTTVCIPICALIAGYLAFRALREFRMISQLERTCLQETTTTSTEPSKR